MGGIAIDQAAAPGCEEARFARPGQQAAVGALDVLLPGRDIHFVETAGTAVGIEDIEQSLLHPGADVQAAV